MAKTGKTLNEIKLEFLRKTHQIDTRIRFLTKEIPIATEELKRFQKAKLRATQHLNEAQKYLDQMSRSSSHLVMSLERMSRLIEEDGKEEQIDLSDEKVVELKRREK